MEYKVKSASLQDVATHTQVLYAAASELGEISAGDLLIPVSALVSGFVAADVFVATNLTLSEALTASLADDVITLSGSSAISASNKIHLVIKV